MSALRVPEAEAQGWKCAACGVELTYQEVSMQYLGGLFQVELLGCRECGQVLVTEQCTRSNKCLKISNVKRSHSNRITSMNKLSFINAASFSAEQSRHETPGVKRPWFPTFTGVAFDVIAPTTRDICIRDIAQSLSMQCRFGGHCLRFYSLAEHGLRLSRLVGEKMALCALLHDAAHAYVQDISVPLRPLLEGYDALKQHLWHMIARRFHLPDTLPEAIRKADLRLTATEIEYLLLSTPKSWLPEVTPYTLEELGLNHSKQFGLLPRGIKRLYLERFAELAV